MAKFAPLHPLSPTRFEMDGELLYGRCQVELREATARHVVGLYQYFLGGEVPQRPEHMSDELEEDCRAVAKTLSEAVGNYCEPTVKARGGSRTDRLQTAFPGTLTATHPSSTSPPPSTC